MVDLYVHVFERQARRHEFRQFGTVGHFLVYRAAGAAGSRLVDDFRLRDPISELPPSERQYVQFV